MKLFRMGLTALSYIVKKPMVIELNKLHDLEAGKRCLGHLNMVSLHEHDSSGNVGLDNTIALSCLHCLLSSITQRGNFYMDELVGKNF